MKKLKYKKYALMTSLMSLGLLLSGCVRYDRDTGEASGWVYEYIGVPAAKFIDWLAHIFGNNYGVAIIIITILMRLATLPSTIKMQKSSIMTQAKMKYAQPEIQEINDEIKATDDTQVKMQLQQELQQVYKKYNINMMDNLSGCLPLVIQLPFISAIFAAIRSSDMIAEAQFLGIPLGDKSLLIVVLVIIASLIQSYLMQKSMPQSDNPQAQQTSNTMTWINPIMMGWITWSSAAGLGIYFLTSSIFMIFQQFFTYQVLRPQLEAKAEEEAEQYKQLPKRKRVTPVANTNHNNRDRLVPTKNQVKAPGTGRRNEGKQRRR